MSTDRTHQFIHLLSKAAKTGEEGVFEDGVGGRFRVTVERIEPERPRWWWWNGEDWAEEADPGAYIYMDVNLFGRPVCTVYGTTADRDAKRDALLEAARKAGEAA